MPIPVSVTVTRACPCASLHTTITVPPGGVYLMAVVKQVEKELSQPVRFAFDLTGVGEVDTQIQPLLSRRDLHVLDNVAHQVVKANGLQVADAECRYPHGRETANGKRGG